MLEGFRPFRVSRRRDVWTSRTQGLSLGLRVQSSGFGDQGSGFWV